MRKYTKYWNYNALPKLIFVFNIFIVSILVSVEVNAQFVHSVFERIGSEHGLSQSSVWSIYQDSKGFMWFGTANGLNRYDGYSFKVYKNDPTDAESLSSNEVVKIVEDKNSHLWIQTRDGISNLNCLDLLTGKVRRYFYSPTNKNGLSSNIITDIYKDSKGDIWVNADGTLEKVQHKDNNQDSVYFKHYQVSKRKEWMIFEDSKGNFMVIGDSIYCLNRKTDKIFNTGTSLNGNVIPMSIVENRKGEIWLGSSFLGLRHLIYDAGKNRYECVPVPWDVTSNRRNILCLDPWDRIWLTTEGDVGLYCFNPKDNSLINFKTDKYDVKSLSDNTQYSLFIDNCGVLWIGTSSNGLCKYDLYQKQFEHYKNNVQNDNSLGGSIISSIQSITPNEIWVGLDMGCGVDRIVYDAGGKPNFYHYRNNPQNKNSLRGNNVISLTQLHNGDVWVNSAFSLVSKITPERAGSKNSPTIMDFSKIAGWHFVVLQDSQKKLWLGGFGSGVIRLSENYEIEKNYKNIANEPTSLIDNIVWAILEDNAKNIWVGTRGAGISVLTPSEQSNEKPKFININPNGTKGKQLISGYVNVIFQDKNSDIWLGTNAGLSKLVLKNKNLKNINSASDFEFLNYTIHDGLPSEVVFGIEEDKHGNLWLSTGNGLVKFNKNAKTFTNYDINDGIQSNEFLHNAYFKDFSGRMFFGGNNGITAFYPDSIQPNRILAKTVLTSFKLFNKPVWLDSSYNGQILLTKPIEYTDEIILNHKNNVFTLEFSALNYTHPAKNKYAYILEGFDKDWNYTGSNRRYAAYTSLPAGEYTFKVKASNADGIWNEKDICQLKITILPPWWATWWFRTLVILSIIASAYRYYKYKVNILNQHKKELEQKVKERTNELQEANIELKEKQEEILQQNEEITQQAEELFTQSELLAEQNKKLKELDKFKETITGSIVHDLKNPLNSIIVLSEMMQSYQENPEDAMNLKVMNQSGKQMLQMVMNILDAQKLENAKMKVELQLLDIHELFQEAMRQVPLLLEQKGLNVEILLESPCNIFVDHSLMVRVFTNLLTNAIKFSHKNGVLQFGKINSEQPNYIICYLKDNGCGIKAEKLPTIFEKFSQAEARDSGQTKSTGLGLNFCKLAIEAFGGRIWAESEVGVGTTFYIELKTDC